MMKRVILILIPAALLAQDFEFTQEWDTIPVEVEEYHIPVPWTGGYSQTSPAYCDIDGDNDYDLLMGYSRGCVAYFQNCGSAINPDFSLIDDEFQGIEGFAHSVIDLADMDNDGDFDLLFDCGNSPMKYYINNGNSNTPIFEALEDTIYDFTGNYIDGTDFCLADIDADGDQDLFVGIWYTGAIKYYQNIGDSTQYSFLLIDTNFAGVNTGYWSSPAFCDTDDDGDLDFFIGSKYGNIWYCRNDGTPEVYDFADPVQNWLGIDVGDYASPEFCDLDWDGDYDLFIGKENDFTFDIPGAIHYWENIGTPQIPDFVEVTQSYLTFDAGRSTSVDLCDIDNDNDFDLFFITNAQLGWMENTGSASDPAFNLQTYDLFSMPPSSCDLADLNGDGVADLVLANQYGGDFTFYENISQPGQLLFQEMGYLYTDYVISEVNLVDINADGDNDLLFGAWTAYPQGLAFVYYENVGTPEHPDFSFVTENYQDIASLWIAMIIPRMVDVDLDNDFDLLLTDPQTLMVWYFENVGTPQQAQLDSVTNDFLGLGNPGLGLYVNGSDIDDDNDVDIFVGRGYGGINFLRNVTGEPAVPPLRRHPQAGLHLSLGPNPANPVTWVTFHLPTPQKATLAVYNLLGQKVATLAQGLQPPGTNKYLWNASQFSSGVYIIRLETEKEDFVSRVTVLK